MCVRVQFVSARTFRLYDPDRNVVRIPFGLEGEFAVRAVRRVLSELAAEQPPSGARCWCGEPVQLLSRVPLQREDGDQVVIRHGA